MALASEPSPLPYKNLYEVPGFAGLRDVTQSFDIEIMVHGGFVRRIVTASRKPELDPIYPEEVTFFCSDIGVVHSGSTAQTPAVTEAIIQAIPFGESIRWQVKSSEENAIFDAAMPFNGIVPANLMSITTSQDWGIKDEWHGQVDIWTRKYRYVRNGFYKDSPLHRAGRDLEIFSALLYFKVLVDDLILGEDLENQPGLGAAKTVIHSACSSTVMIESLQESAYLRARLLYLMKDIRALALNSSDWKDQVDQFGLDRLLDYLQEDEMFNLGKQVTELVRENRTVTISARLGGDRYRMEESQEEWLFGDDATKPLEETLAKYSNTIADEQRPELGIGQRTVCASPALSLNQGRSSSSRSGDSVHEFFHFAVPVPRHQNRDLSESEFAVLLDLSSSGEGADGGRRVILSVPSVCATVKRKNEGMLYVRVNAFGFLENSMALTRTPPEGQVTAKVFVVETVPSALPEPSIVSTPETKRSSPLPSSRAVVATPAIIFVHGILSNCSSCFEKMLPSFRDDERLSTFRLGTFDYDYDCEMPTSSEKLTSFIGGNFPGSSVTLVCHSMGGLVGRLAVLSGRVPQVKRLIMLGTPNFGAIRTAQLGLLSQIGLRLAGKIYAVFRNPGIRDLTRVTEIFREPIAQGRKFADDVEYVTIPGEFFNESRAVWDRGGRSDQKLAVAGFATLNLVTELLMAAPLWRVGLKKPHDGIVESASNSLIPCSAGRLSEKCATINDPVRFGRTYVHVTHEHCSDLIHVMIQQDPAIVELVKNLVLADSISKWRSDMDSETSRTLTASFD
jgi:pimeloyl-ACP methyl ester carboxylesterase